MSALVREILYSKFFVSFFIKSTHTYPLRNSRQLASDTSIFCRFAPENYVLCNGEERKGSWHRASILHLGWRLNKDAGDVR